MKTPASEMMPLSLSFGDRSDCFFGGRSDQSRKYPARINSGIVTIKSPVPKPLTHGCAAAPNIHVIAVNTLPISAAKIPPVKQQKALIVSHDQTTGLVLCLSTQRTYRAFHKDGIRSS